MEPTVRPGNAEQTPGRGVVHGAFRVLEALGDAPEGMGLSDLSRVCALPKATTYRLVEQLVDVGAVQRHERRYFVGELLARLGRSWQPSPRLRRIARDPVATLAKLTRTAVTLTVLDGDRVRVVTASLGSAMPPLRPGSDLAGRTAAGQVLLATRPGGDRPDGFSALEWRRFQAELRRNGAVTVDHADVAPGVRCVAAPIRLPGDAGTASISALVTDGTGPAHLLPLVVRAADQIARDLAVH
jgi:IclR family acetate operon transcriptional repressor